MEEFIKTINHYDYEKFRDRVVKACNVSLATWSNWKNGETVSVKYQPIIDFVADELFGRKVFKKGGDQ